MSESLEAIPASGGGQQRKAGIPRLSGRSSGDAAASFRDDGGNGMIFLVSSR